MGGDKGFHTYGGPCSIHRLFESEMGFREDRKIIVDARLPLPAHVDVEGVCRGVGNGRGRGGERGKGKSENK